MNPRGTAVAILVLMLVGSAFAKYPLAAAGLALTTFSAFVISPSLFSNLAIESTTTAGEGVAKPSAILRATAWLIAFLYAARAAALAMFLIGAGIVTVGIVVAATTINVAVSGALLALGFSVCYVAYSALVLLWMARATAETLDLRPEAIATWLGSARGALWLGSVAFIVGSGLGFADALF